MRENFHLIAQKLANWMGTAGAFGLALISILVWAFCGPLFHYSDTWQLVINTSTTIITFLMVFLIQNTQNRDARAMHLKLDELIRANVNARNHLIDLESMSDAELDELHQEFCEAQKITQDRLEDIEERREKKKSHSPHRQEPGT